MLGAEFDDAVMTVTGCLTLTREGHHREGLVLTAVLVLVSQVSGAGVMVAVAAGVAVVVAAAGKLSNCSCRVIVH